MRIQKLIFLALVCLSVCNSTQEDVNYCVMDAVLHMSDQGRQHAFLLSQHIVSGHEKIKMVVSQPKKKVVEIKKTLQLHKLPGVANLLTQASKKAPAAKNQAEGPGGAWRSSLGPVSKKKLKCIGLFKKCSGNPGQSICKKNVKECRKHWIVWNVDLPSKKKDGDQEDSKDKKQPKTTVDRVKEVTKCLMHYSDCQDDPTLAICSSAKEKCSKLGIILKDKKKVHRIRKPTTKKATKTRKKTPKKVTKRRKRTPIPSFLIRQKTDEGAKKSTKPGRQRDARGKRDARRQKEARRQIRGLRNLISKMRRNHNLKGRRFRAQNRKLRRHIRRLSNLLRKLKTGARTNNRHNRKLRRRINKLIRFVRRLKRSRILGGRRARAQNNKLKRQLRRLSRLLRKTQKNHRKLRAGSQRQRNANRRLRRKVKQLQGLVKNLRRALKAALRSKARAIRKPKKRLSSKAFHTRMAKLHFRKWRSFQLKWRRNRRRFLHFLKAAQRLKRNLRKAKGGRRRALRRKFRQKRRLAGIYLRREKKNRRKAGKHYRRYAYHTRKLGKKPVDRVSNKQTKKDILRRLKKLFVKKLASYHKKKYRQLLKKARAIARAYNRRRRAYIRGRRAVETRRRQKGDLKRLRTLRNTLKGLRRRYKRLARRAKKHFKKYALHARTFGRNPSPRTRLAPLKRLPRRPRVPKKKGSKKKLNKKKYRRQARATQRKLNRLARRARAITRKFNRKRRQYIRARDKLEKKDRRPASKVRRLRTKRRPLRRLRRAHQRLRRRVKRETRRLASLRKKLGRSSARTSSPRLGRLRKMPRRLKPVDRRAILRAYHKKMANLHGAKMLKALAKAKKVARAYNKKRRAYTKLRNKAEKSPGSKGYKFKAQLKRKRKALEQLRRKFDNKKSQAKYHYKRYAHHTRKQGKRPRKFPGLKKLSKLPRRVRLPSKKALQRRVHAKKANHYNLIWKKYVKKAKGNARAFNRGKQAYKRLRSQVEKTHVRKGAHLRRKLRRLRAGLTTQKKSYKKNKDKAKVSYRKYATHKRKAGGRPERFPNLKNLSKLPRKPKSVKSMLRHHHSKSAGNLSKRFKRYAKEAKKNVKAYKKNRRAYVALRTKLEAGSARTKKRINQLKHLRNALVGLKKKYNQNKARAKNHYKRYAEFMKKLSKKPEGLTKLPNLEKLPRKPKPEEKTDISQMNVPIKKPKKKKKKFLKIFLNEKNRRLYYHHQKWYFHHKQEWRRNNIKIGHLQHQYQNITRQYLINKRLARTKGRRYIALAKREKKYLNDIKKSIKKRQQRVDPLKKKFLYHQKMMKKYGTDSEIAYVDADKSFFLYDNKYLQEYQKFNIDKRKYMHYQNCFNMNKRNKGCRDNMKKYERLYQTTYKKAMKNMKLRDLFQDLLLRRMKQIEGVQQYQYSLRLFVHYEQR